MDAAATLAAGARTLVALWTATTGSLVPAMSPVRSMEELGRNAVMSLMSGLAAEQKRRDEGVFLSGEPKRANGDRRLSSQLVTIIVAP